MNLTRGINLRKIAELMPGASGAEVKVRIGPLNGSSWVVNEGLYFIFLCVYFLGCLHRGRDVRSERKESSCQPGGL